MISTDSWGGDRPVRNAASPGLVGSLQGQKSPGVDRSIVQMEVIDPVNRIETQLSRMAQLVAARQSTPDPNFVQAQLVVGLVIDASEMQNTLENGAEAGKSFVSNTVRNAGSSAGQGLFALRESAKAEPPQDAPRARTPGV